MVLVVVTKGQQEALIPLAPVQKTVHSHEGFKKKNTADFSAANSFWWSLRSRHINHTCPAILARCPRLYFGSSPLGILN